jgi:hypothetical protein
VIRPSHLIALLAALAALLVAPALASADYEQMADHFGVGGEAEQLEEATAVAINTTGAGGVEPGTFYVVGLNGRVVRYGPGSEGEAPPFREAWGWGVGNEASEYQRCGPALATDGTQHTFHTCTRAPAVGLFGGEQSGHFQILAGVAVDQATGNVYVLNESQETPQPREHHLVEVFNATGTAVGPGFGDAARKSPVESIAEAPEKLHVLFPLSSALTVDEAGTVYITDVDYTGAPNAESRVASFKPQSPGDFEHYVYAGQQDDITTAKSDSFRRLGLVGADRLVVATLATIREYAIGGGNTPICSRAVSGQIEGMATNSVSGEVFYYTFADRKIHRLQPCNEATGEFQEAQAALKPTPVTGTMSALAVNPGLAWGPSRPVGTLYAADGEEHRPQRGSGDVFAPARAFSPEVGSESVASTGTTSTTLKASIDPRGFTTRYRFQYLSEQAYEANEPNERQSLTVEATGGLLGLAFEGRHLGGTFAGDLSAGSKLVENVVSAKALADVHAAQGTANLSGAVGKGTLISGSKLVTGTSVTEGAFAVGQTIAGEGIPTGTTIAAIAGSELTLSATATKTGAGAVLKSGTTKISGLTTKEGTFEVGETIEGPGIASRTTINAVTPTELTLSKATEKPGTAVAITAGSLTLSGVLASEGTFEPGAPISGEGIQSGTTITAVHPGSLVISQPPTKPGSSVAVSSGGPAPLAVGETVEGPGIPSGTKIVVAEAGQLILSASAESTTAGAHLRAGLPFAATPAEVENALEGLATIGEGNVKVSGGPGDQAGSAPYVVEFAGSLTNQDLPEFEADASGLTGGPATATVATENNGGEGFSDGATEVPTGGGEISSGGVGVAATAITGLLPDTEYRFRAVATSECEGPGEPLCEAGGAAASFRTYPEAAPAPPDGRRYELVSPADKQGGEVFPADPKTSSCLGDCKPPGSFVSVVFPMQSAPDGNAVAFMGYPFSPTEGAAVFNSYLARRTATGWTTTALSPGLQATKQPGTLAVDDQLNEGLISQGSPLLSPDAPAGYPNFYLQNTDDPGQLEPILSTAPPNRPPGPGSLVLGYAGHTPDFSAQFFTANDALTEATAFAPEPPDPGQTGRDLYEFHDGSLALVNVLPGNASVATGAAFVSSSPDTHAVSADGRRVYWHVGSTLYVREDGEITREVKHAGEFLTASEDGQTVLLSDGCLYSLLTESCTDLTQGEVGFEGISGQSNDLSRIYFVDTAALAGSGENERNQSAEPGKPNLYLFEEGAQTHFIATLLRDDHGPGPLNPVDWGPASGQRTAEASPSGRYLAFVSKARLTGYANVGPCEKLGVGQGEVLVQSACAEVFLYDSQTGTLSCPSCNPTGEAPRGPSTLRLISAAPPSLPQPRYLTDSGRLFFDSGDRLSALDTNGRVEDVYEAEPEGVGSCARAGGCVLLVSPGSGAVDSNFLATEPSGANVFFTSRERLVLKDSDELVDLYDAREGGGFPAETETQRSECQGEACQPAASPPSAPTPNSSSFQGAGNVHEKAAKKKQKKHKHKKRAAKRKHKHGGAK